MKDDMSKYTVFLTRCVIQTATVQVEAASEEAAREEALTTRLPEDKQWTGKFDSENYSPFVVEVGNSEEEGGEEGSDAPTHLRYALLQADLFGGDGELIPQAWMASASELLVADVSSDWEKDVGALANSTAEEYFGAMMRDGRPTAVIIPFPGQRDDDAN